MKNNMIVSLISLANTSRLLSMVGMSAILLTQGGNKTTRTIEGLTRLGFKSAAALGMSGAKAEKWLSAAYPQKNG